MSMSTNTNRCNPKFNLISHSYSGDRGFFQLGRKLSAEGSQSQERSDSGSPADPTDLTH
jgi:hypothetical protein